MELPRFVIAKCIPDVFRNEPRNIGVVLWSPDGVVARFIGEKPDAPGEVDETEVPLFVASAHAYRQWIRYWRREMAKETIRPARGTPVPRSSPAFLDALAQTDPGNFRLADGGMLAEAVPVAELPAAVEYLFATCVAESVPVAPSVPNLPPQAAPAAPGRTPVNQPTPFPSGRRAQGSPYASVFKRIALILGVEHPGEVPADELHRLRAENRELRSLLEEMRDLLQDADAVEEQFTAREGEYQAALAALGARIDELRAGRDADGE